MGTQALRRGNKSASQWRAVPLRAEAWPTSGPCLPAPTHSGCLPHPGQLGRSPSSLPTCQPDPAVGVGLGQLLALPAMFARLPPPPASMVSWEPPGIKVPPHPAYSPGPCSGGS